MEKTGMIIKEVGVTAGQSKNGRTWRKATYVMETIESYPKRMAFDVFDGEGGRIDRLGIHAGQKMKIFFDIDAHEVNGRWFNSITAFDARAAE